MATRPSKVRSVVALGIVAWAAALQGHMWYLQSTDEFKKRFPDLSPEDDTETSQLRIRLRGTPSHGEGGK